MVGGQRHIKAAFPRERRGNRFVCVCVCVYIQGVPGGMCQISGECSLC